MSVEAKTDPGIYTAMDRYYKFCQDNNLRSLAEADEYHAMDYATGFEDARKRGIYEGRAEGKAEGRAEGKAEGRAEGKAESVQQLLQLKFPQQNSAMLLSRIKSISSMDLLDKIFAVAVTANSLEDIEKAFIER